jgi:hypothetical protein
VVLLITKPLEFKAKLVGHFLLSKPTTVQFPNLQYAIPELNTTYFRINSNNPTTYTPKMKRSFVEIILAIF